MSDLATSVAVCLACGYGLALLLSSLLLLAGLPLFRPAALLILVIAFCGTAVLALKCRTPFAWWLVVAACLFVMGLVAGWLVDFSYDGQEYHFDAVYALRRGWNPYHAAYAPFAPPGASILPWPQHYPLGAWLLMALLWTAGLSAEASKVALWVPLMITPLAAYSAVFTVGGGKRSAVAIAAVAALSPIALTQLSTRYVDGMLAELIASFLAFAIVFMQTRGRVAFAGALICMMIALDTKATAIAMFGAASAGVCIVALWRDGARRAAILAISFGGTALATVLTIGWHPYVSNSLEHGNPFYPVFGERSYDVTTMLEPAPLRNRPLPLQILSSVLAPSGFDEVRPKLPFTLSKEEIVAGGSPDTLLGGFGPLFSGAALLAIVSAFASVAAGDRRSNATLIIAGSLALSAALTPSGWVARYVPQLWLAVLVMAAAASLTRSRIPRYIGWSAVAVLGANSLAEGAAAARIGYLTTVRIRSNVAEARQQHPFCAAFGSAHARIQLMRDSGADVVPLAQPLPLRCAGSGPVPSAYDFFDRQAQSCPCDRIAHDPSGRWTVKPDTTAADIATYRLLHR